MSEEQLNPSKQSGNDIRIVEWWAPRSKSSTDIFLLYVHAKTLMST